MTMTITLNDIYVRRWSVDMELETVTVEYHLMRDTGEIFDTHQAVFWRNLPADPNPPDNWYQLPSQYVPTLASLTADARTALLHLVNEGTS